MSEHAAIQNRRFGQYLRRVREERRLSLDAVEEMTLGYPGRVTKSHLSRIENGQAEPTFPRMFALSQVYGVPITSLAERFQIDLQQALIPEETAQQSIEELLERGRKLRIAGRYADGLLLCEALLDRKDELDALGDEGQALMAEIRLTRVACLVQLSRYASAKDEVEDVLSTFKLTNKQRVIALHYFTSCCYRLGKYEIAIMAIAETESALGAVPSVHRLHGSFAGTKGNLMYAIGDMTEAARSFKKASDCFGQLGNHFETCRFRLNFITTLIDLGKRSEARKHIQAVLKMARENGYDRQQAHAISDLGKLAFLDDDLEAAESYLLQSNTIARAREFVPAVFRNCYYLWKIALARGDSAAAKSFERTLRTYLNRVDEYMPEAKAYREHVAGGEE